MFRSLVSRILLAVALYLSAPSPTFWSHVSMLDPTDNEVADQIEAVPTHNVNKFLVAGGNGNWDDTSNWSLLTGGVSGAPVPGAGDAVAFDSNSGNAAMTVNVASACASLIMSGTYAGTLTFNSTLTLTSTCTFIAGCTIAGAAGTLICTGTATLTSGGKTLTCALNLTGGSVTYTLGDNWTVTGLVTIGNSGTGGTALTSNQLTCNGGLHMAVTTGTVSGTAKIVLGGGTVIVAPVR